MALTPGTRIGVYDITAPIGVGGMGEVYRARDTKLGRDVALKVVSETFTHDPERVARFQREARLLAALNHPHIATIHGLEESAGGQLLVMELVEGGTLAERLKAGPLPVDEALSIARQVADALQAAHEKGIIHRDLKPANIAFTADGQVKVLDFGLAKALDGAGELAGMGVTQSPTLSFAATQAGVILGTAAYMAPEQAKGKPADRRSDIWAFGCVLYEMLAGRRAFDGEDASDTMAAVLRADVDWSALPADLPPAIRTLVRRALERDRRKRMADASTALLLIDESPLLGARSVADEGSNQREAALQQQLAAAVTTQRTLARVTRRRMVLLGGLTLLVGALAAGLAVWSATRPAPPRVTRFAFGPSDPSQILVGGSSHDIAISPDGTRVVYASPGQPRWFIRAVDQLEPTPLGPGLGARTVGPFFSPDGEWVAFNDQADNTLKRIPVRGGPVVTIGRLGPWGMRGASWAADGTIVFGINRAGGLWRIPAAGGEPVELTKTSADGVIHAWPDVLPGGTAVLFAILPTGAGDGQIAIVDLRTGEQRTLVDGGTAPRYSPTGHIVYAFAGTLRAVAFDLGRLEVTGDPVPVLEGVVTQASGAADFALAQDGSLLYLSGTGRTTQPRLLAWVGRDGSEAPIAAPPRPYVSPRVSPDGRRVAVTIESLDHDVWIYTFERGTLERLTSDRSEDREAVWMPDGARIVYYAAGREGGAGMFWRRADGIGDPERLTTGNHRPWSVSPDGQRIVFTDLGSPTLDLHMITLAEPRTVQPLVASPTVNETAAAISPDGRWLAYGTDDTGQIEVFVRPFPDVNSGRYRVSTEGGAVPFWAPDTGALFYRLNEAIMRVAVRAGGPTAWGSPEEAFGGSYFLANSPRHVDIDRLGQRFLTLKNVENTDGDAPPRQIILVQNWLEELKRLVPTN